MCDGREVQGSGIDQAKHSPIASKAMLSVREARQHERTGENSCGMMDL